MPGNTKSTTTSTGVAGSSSSNDSLGVWNKTKPRGAVDDTTIATPPTPPTTSNKKTPPSNGTGTANFAGGFSPPTTRTGPGNMELMEVRKSNTDPVPAPTGRTTYNGVLHQVDGGHTNQDGKLCFDSIGLIYYSNGGHQEGGQTGYQEGGHTGIVPAAPPEGRYYRTKMKWEQLDNDQLRIDQSNLSFQLYHVGRGQSHFFQMKRQQDFLLVQKDLTDRLQRYPRPPPPQQQQQAAANNRGSTSRPTRNKVTAPSNGTNSFAPPAPPPTTNGSFAPPAPPPTTNGSASLNDNGKNAANDSPITRQEFEALNRRLKEIEKLNGLDSNNASSANPPTSNNNKTPPSNATGNTSFASGGGGGSSFASSCASTSVSAGTSPPCRFDMIEMRLNEIEKRNGINASFCLLPWRSIGNEQGVARRDEEIGGRDGAFGLPKDVYSILATWNWKSKPFWMSIVVVFGFQVTLLILLVKNTLDDSKTPLNVPVNVESEVRIAQCIAVFVAMVMQDDLRVGIAGFFQGLPDSFRGNERFKRITKLQWQTAYMIRSIQGLMSLLASFILLMQAGTVIDLLQNFLGVTFISDLDDRFFALGALGYLGNANMHCTEEISRAEFHRDETKHPTGNRCSTSWCRKSMHVLGVFAVLVGMLCCYVTFTSEQFRGAYSIDIVRVEFGDETVPSLGLFNGCYKRGDARERASAGRVVYSIDSESGSTTRGGAFAFCSEMNRWTFYDVTIGNECKDYIVKSEKTRTFDVIDAGKLQWYTEDDEPLELLKVTKSDQCERKSLVPPDACQELELEGTLLESRSRFYEMVESPPKISLLDPALSHAIYVGLANSEVVLFTGRRWVIADAEKLSSTSNLTNASDIEKFFFTNNMFDVKNQVKNWITFISEEVSSVKDRGTPLGLRWYYPRYEEDYGYNFSAADLSRPYDAVFACARCDDSLNPCNYGGTCQANGTCLCANGASGELCREKPLGNGECNPYFNEDVYDYDGGDCCGSTCEGGLCGTPPSFNPFGIENVTVEADVFDRYYAYETSMGTIAASDYVKRYVCRDPEMATFTIEILNMEGAKHDRYIDVESIGCTFGSLSVRCDGKLYLQTPSLIFPADSRYCNQSHVERVHVPYGAKCELTFVDPSSIEGYGFEYGVTLYYGDNGTNSTAIWQNEVRGGEVTWDVPSSKCLTDVFNATLDIFNRSTFSGAAINRLAADALSDYQCISDADMVKERYFLTLLDQSVSFPSTAWDLHQCQGWGFPAVRIECNQNNRIIYLSKSSTLERPTGGTLPTEVAFLSHLETLDLNYINLNGTIPTELGSLTALNELVLSRNDLTGQIPSQLGRLAAMTWLDLSFNHLTGQIPSQLGNLTALIWLDLSSNDLNGTIPSQLGSLTALTLLGLAENNLTGTIPVALINPTSLGLSGNRGNLALPTEIGLLTDLTTIGFPYNNLGGSIPSEIGLMTKLTQLWLHDNDLTGTIPKELGNLTALKRLFLRSNDLSGPIPRDLGRLTALNHLYLDGNYLSGTIQSELGSLTALTSLWLYGNDLSGTIASELGHLTALLSLRLHMNDLSGPIPTELGHLTALTTLWLSENDLSGPIPGDLGSLTALNDLWLYDNDLTGQIPSQLGNLTALNGLSLHGNDLNGTIPKELGNLTALNELWLQDNDLNGTIPKELGDLTALYYLYLSSNDLTGQIPSQVGYLTSLNHLYLQDNDLTSQIPSELGMLQYLRILSLHKNSLTGSIPKELGNLTALHELSLSMNDLTGPIPSELANVQGWPGHFPNGSNAITINIRTDSAPEETSFEWSKRNESGLWEVLEFENPSNDSRVHSYTKEVYSDTLCKLEIIDSESNGIWNGWFTVTNSTPSQNFDEGTLIWEASGSELEDSLVVYIWVDSNGHTQVAEQIPGEGFALEGGDVILLPDTTIRSSLLKSVSEQEHQSGARKNITGAGASLMTGNVGAEGRNIFLHD